MAKSRKQELNLKQLEYLAQAYRELAQIIEAGTNPSHTVEAAKVVVRQTLVGYIKLNEDFSKATVTITRETA